MAEQFGALIGWLLTPMLILGIIGAIQFFRTGDYEEAQRSATSWWAILIAIFFFLLSIFSRFAQAFV